MSWDWRGFYSSQHDLRTRLTILNYDYRTISRSFPGWSLADIKGLTTRERRFWLAVSKYEKDAIEAMKPSV